MCTVPVNDVDQQRETLIVRDCLRLDQSCPFLQAVSEAVFHNPLDQIQTIPKKVNIPH